MSAAYDNYDYPTYWRGREYEHASEVIALKAFLARIEKITSLIDIGAGYGRLTSCYLFRAKKIILSDSSAKLLKIARKKYSQNNIRIIQTSLEKLNKKIKNKSVDVAIMIRVLHHISDIDKCFNIVSKILKNKGYFIIEFPNKKHFKATFLQFLKGNFTFPIDIFPKDIRSKKSKKLNTLPFLNYHPDDIIKKLNENCFEIIEKRSVSNIRLSLIKKYLPINFLIKIESLIQIPLSKYNFGPSIFILARKKD